MALINCPHCGQPISDSASQCPHCQNQIVTSYQRNRIKKFSSIAMWLCIVGLVFFLIGNLYEIFVYSPNITSMSQEEWRIWYADHLAVINLMTLISVISSLCICSAWLVWLVREKGHRKAIQQIGVVICIIGVCVRMLRIIPTITWVTIFDFDSRSISIFFGIHNILCNLLNAALGIVVICLANNSITKKLTSVAGIALIINSLYLLVRVAITEQNATMSPLLEIIDPSLWCCAIVIFIVLFYNTYNKAEIE